MKRSEINTHIAEADNCFAEKRERFQLITEDAAANRLIVNDYVKV